MSPIYVPGKVVLAQVSQPLDADAQAYVNAVEVADRQRIEDPVRFAINNFVIGCKADGIWPAIKASCILAGARTLTGALVPLVGTAPTNANFVAGDYNRKTGLAGDGSTKYLNSNRNNNVDPQNNNHNAAYISTIPTIGVSIMGAGTGGLDNEGTNNILLGGTRSRNKDIQSFSSSSTGGLVGMSRPSSSSYSNRANNTNSTFTQNSEAAIVGNIFLFARNQIAGNLGPGLYSNARLAFYSIGESLDLAKLDTRVTDLINAFAAAIP